MRDYQLRLAPRNEGLRYVDASGAYRFNLSRRGDTWTVSVPPTKEPELSPAILSADEEAKVLSRVTSFLSRVRWLGVWPRNYRVQFVTRQDA
jgi:hypothetical protein